jgi:hypothetical protein
MIIRPRSVAWAAFALALSKHDTWVAAKRDEPNHAYDYDPLVLPIEPFYEEVVSTPAPSMAPIDHVDVLQV